MDQIKERIKQLDAELSATVERQFLVTVHMPKKASIQKTLDYIATAIASYADSTDNRPEIVGEFQVEHLRKRVVTLNN